MTDRDIKKSMVKDAYDTMKLSSSITFNDFANTAVIAIPLNTILIDGVSAWDIKVLTRPNLTCMKVAQFHLLFIYDTEN